jgi:hypothetical protein
VFKPILLDDCPFYWALACQFESVSARNYRRCRTGLRNPNLPHKPADHNAAHKARARARRLGFFTARSYHGVRYQTTCFTGGQPATQPASGVPVRRPVHLHWARTARHEHEKLCLYDRQQQHHSVSAAQAGGKTPHSKTHCSWDAMYSFWGSRSACGFFDLKTVGHHSMV